MRRELVIALLLFVAVALGASVWRNTRPRPDTGEAERDGTVVYYLHGTFRCAACNAIEAAGKRIVETEFAEERAAGPVRWRPVNYQENTRLAKRYNVAGNMILVARFANGRAVETRRLDRVMELADHPDRLEAYIRDGLGGTAAPAAGAPLALSAALAAAFGLGLLTSISPCPLATNIAAVAFLSRSASRSRTVLWSGLCYTLGRTIVYVGLGVLILYGLQRVWGGGAASGLSRFLLTWGGALIGPALILGGMLLLGLLRSARALALAGQGLQQRAAGGGGAWAFVLGVLFALSFCPISATLFFGSMIALSSQSRAPVLLPAAYGLATALPVIAFAILIAFAGGYVGKAFDRVALVDRWLRRIAGAAFILAGVYYSLTHLGLLSLMTT